MIDDKAIKNVLAAVEEVLRNFKEDDPHEWSINIHSDDGYTVQIDAEGRKKRNCLFTTFS